MWYVWVFGVIVLKSRACGSDDDWPNTIKTTVYFNSNGCALLSTVIVTWHLQKWNGEKPKQTKCKQIQWGNTSINTILVQLKAALWGFFTQSTSLVYTHSTIYKNKMLRRLTFMDKRVLVRINPQKPEENNCLKRIT